MKDEGGLLFPGADSITMWAESHLPNQQTGHCRCFHPANRVSAQLQDFLWLTVWSGVSLWQLHRWLSCRAGNVTPSQPVGYYYDSVLCMTCWLVVKADLALEWMKYNDTQEESERKGEWGICKTHPHTNTHLCSDPSLLDVSALLGIQCVHMSVLDSTCVCMCAYPQSPALCTKWSQWAWAKALNGPAPPTKSACVCAYVHVGDSNANVSTKLYLYQWILHHTAEANCTDSECTANKANVHSIKQT